MRDGLNGACQRGLKFLCPSMNCCRGSGGIKEKGRAMSAGTLVHREGSMNACAKSLDCSDISVGTESRAALCRVVQAHPALIIFFPLKFTVEKICKELF